MGETTILGSVFRLFILPLLFFSMVAFAGGKKYTQLDIEVNRHRSAIGNAHAKEIQYFPPPFLFLLYKLQ